MLLLYALLYLIAGLVIGLVKVALANDPWDVIVEGAHPVFQVALITIMWDRSSQY